MAIAAVPGLFAGICIFVASFFGLTMDRLGGWVFVLHFGVFALFIPLVTIDRWSKGVDPFRGKPRWVLRSSQALFLLFVVVFFTFLALSHAASPEIINGEYALYHHGGRVEHLSEQDFLFVKGWELRLFATGWILFYFALMMHWWFPRQNEWTVVMPD
jgi:hypothetical protein